ncbi:hypothetical protein [Micromonospora sp. NPDC004704]
METGSGAPREVVRSSTGYRAAFDRLFDQGRTAVQTGNHYRDSPPVDGGRWGMSVVLQPDARYAMRLAEVTAAAQLVAGAAHWPTGAPDAVHLTVRAIQAHRSVIPANDPLATRWAAALGRAAAASRPVRLRFQGLTLTPSGVMACAYPADSAADDFAARLAEELGEDGWFETGFVRDIWYATLIHFSGPIRHLVDLVDWVAARRDLELGQTIVHEAELVRFRYNGRQPIRVALATAPFGAPHS